MLTLAALLLIGQPAPASAAPVTIRWQSPEGQRFAYEGRIERPARGAEPIRDVAVMLFGGGLAADIHWTTPGSYEQDGQIHKLTIDGTDARDADTLAAALTDAGFTVLRHSAVALDDPLHAENPAMAQARPFPDTVEIARAAWDQLLDASGFEPERVFVVGHSLGAARAVLASDAEAGGYVFLAGAYVSPQRTAPRTLIAEADDGPGEDYDASGSVAGWERAASKAIRDNELRSERPLEVGGVTHEWPSDLLLSSDAPVLAIWGGLDTMSYHGPVLEHLLADRVDTVYHPTLGHNLGRERGGLTGPIEAEVVDAVVDWIVSRAGE